MKARAEPPCISKPSRDRKAAAAQPVTEHAGKPAPQGSGSPTACVERTHPAKLPEPVRSRGHTTKLRHPFMFRNFPKWPVFCGTEAAPR